MVVQKPAKFFCLLILAVAKDSRKRLSFDDRRCVECEIERQAFCLSCCHSGRRTIQAEGVVGIARAFLGAGARSVIAS